MGTEIPAARAVEIVAELGMQADVCVHGNRNTSGKIDGDSSRTRDAGGRPHRHLTKDQMKSTISETRYVSPHLTKDQMKSTISETR
jgi:hypothetical protein